MSTVQGGVFAYVTGRGMVWVESVNTVTRTALVRFDNGEGMRGKVQKVNLANVDFGKVNIRTGYYLNQG